MNDKKTIGIFSAALLLGLILFRANIQWVIALLLLVALLRKGFIGGVVGCVLFLTAFALILQVSPMKGPSEMRYLTGVFYGVAGTVIGSLTHWGLVKYLRTENGQGDEKETPNKAL